MRWPRRLVTLVAGLVAACSLSFAGGAHAATRVLLDSGEVTESNSFGFFFDNFTWTAGSWEIALVTDATVDWLAAYTYAYRHKHVDFDLSPEFSYGVVWDIYTPMTITQTADGYRFRFVVEGGGYRYFGAPGQGYSVHWYDQIFRPEFLIDFSPTGASSSYAFYASAVPEPAVWAMMIAGFGLVGVGLRRRLVAEVPPAVGLRHVL